MSPKAKYGWAIGLIVIGVVFALPFRNVQTQDAEKVANAKVEKEEVGVEETNVADANNSLTNSPLMPGDVAPSKEALENVEANKRKMIGQFDQTVAETNNFSRQLSVTTE